MSDIFISYARENRDTAQKLAAVLEAQGWSVWWDRKIVAGQSFDRAIEHELETARAAIVLWSGHSVSSDWVKNEAAVAKERGVLIPALIDRAKLPLEFRHIQAVDLTDWDGDTSHGGLLSLFEALSVALTGEAPRPPVNPQPPSPSPRPRIWLAVSIAAIAVILGVVAYFMFVPVRPETVVVREVGPDKVEHLDEEALRREILEEVAGRDNARDLSQPPSEQRIRKLAQEQREIMGKMIGQDKSAGLRNIERNLEKIDSVIKSFPKINAGEDAGLFVAAGYALKDMYQDAKGRLPANVRREYLSRARSCFAQSLRLNSKDAGAVNGMGNVLFLEGRFDESLQYHTRAIQLAGGKDKYPAAEHDRQLVMDVKSGKIPFDF